MAQRLEAGSDLDSPWANPSLLHFLDPRVVVKDRYCEPSWNTPGKVSRMGASPWPLYTPLSLGLIPLWEGETYPGLYSFLRLETTHTRLTRGWSGRTESSPWLLGTTWGLCVSSAELTQDQEGVQTRLSTVQMAARRG